MKRGKSQNIYYLHNGGRLQHLACGSGYRGWAHYRGIRCFVYLQRSANFILDAETTGQWASVVCIFNLTCFCVLLLIWACSLKM